MMQICVFNTRLFSLQNTLNYAIHGACLRMVLLTDVYRNLTSLWIKPRERAFQQFKSPVLNVLKIETQLPKNVNSRQSCFFQFEWNKQENNRLIKCNHVTLDYPREITIPKADNTEKEYI